MSSFNVRTCYPQEVTVLSNIFLDRYMPKANGEFVKIYLYLLRAAGSGLSTSLTGIADALNCTEKDVFRALRYWHEEGVISLALSKDAQEVEGITIVNFCGPLASKEEARSDSARKEALGPGDLTAGRIKELSSKAEAQEFLFIAEQYMGHPLARVEVEKLLYFYDGLHFSSELIDYLLEYCISRGHNNIRYIEKVALAWHDSGIRTIEDAKERSASYQKDYYEVAKALGLASPLTDTHLAVIDKWRKDWGFSSEVIKEACSRTVIATAKPTLAYADKILESWHDKGIGTLEDIKRLDSLHAETGTKKKGSPEKAARPRKAVGNFYNFEQRSYDYKSLEAQLLAGANGA